MTYIKNILKVIGISIVTFLATGIVKNLFILFTSGLLANLPITIQAVIDCILSTLIFTIFLSSLWGLLLRDKNLGTSFLQQARFKKVYFILIVIFAIFSIMASIGLIIQYKKSYSLDSTSHFIGDSTYENSKYHFKLVYPKGSVFANAHPESGFVTRFFLPDGESIKNDTENVGIYVKETSGDLEAEAKQMKDLFSRNGPIEIKEVQFGGQKGYRILLASNYSARKGTKELFYITVKNNISYQLNYFPVAKNISIVDSIASSFEFTQ